LFSSNPWCAYVSVTPDASRITVFSRGICRGLNGKIPVGVNIDPNSIVGDKLLWKNMKKNTSEMMNRIIPHRNPFVAIFVCSP
jgi:hypothetical protein